jgi:hypothetical protein
VLRERFLLRGILSGASDAADMRALSITSVSEILAGGETAASSTVGVMLLVYVAPPRRRQ